MRLSRALREGVVAVGLRYNPPPGWPPAPEGFIPPPGWQPDPSWPPAPPGWQLVVNDDRMPTQASPQQTTQASPPSPPPLPGGAAGGLHGGTTSPYAGPGAPYGAGGPARRTGWSAASPARCCRSRARPARWPSWSGSPAASAAGSGIPRSTWFRMICRIVVMMVDPPAAPTLKVGFPLRKAMTGPMLDRGCFPPAGRFGS
jgi:hypothetical protein